MIRGCCKKCQRFKNGECKDGHEPQKGFNSSVYQCGFKKAGVGGKKSKLKTLPKVLKETQSIVNARARKRDGCCLRCKYHNKNTINSLQAHHFIVAQGSSSLFRFDMRNLITLCYGCHIHWLHSNPTIDRIREIERIALLNQICSVEDIDEILGTTDKKRKWTRVELEEVKK